MLGYNAIVPACFNVNINFTFASVCDLWGLTCSPSTPVSLTLPKFCATKIMYQVYLLSSSFATYIFDQVIVTTKHANQQSTC